MSNNKISPTRITNLDHLADFVTVGKLGNYTLAAEHLGVPVSTISRRIRALEARLDTRLFERNTRHVRLTQSGSELLEQLMPLISDIQDVTQNIIRGEQNLSGSMTVSVSSFVAANGVTDWTLEFMRLHPEVRVQLLIGNEFDSLFTQPIDVAIRSGELADSSLIATKLCEPKFTIFGLKALHQKNVSDWDGIAATSCCVPNHWPSSCQLKKQSKTKRLELTTIAMGNAPEPCYRAVELGMGVSLGPRYWVNQQSHLIDLTPDWNVQQPTSLYAVYPSRNHQPTRLTQYISFLKHKMENIY